MKVKLYKGPFNGKSYQTDGRNEILIRGPKPMNRRQRWEWERENYSVYSMQRFPTVEARYRIAMRAIQTGPNSLVNAPATHPDGSVFYEYVKDSKREY